jgi:hypothetical protein
MELQLIINSNNSPTLFRTSVGGLLDSNKFRFMLQVRFQDLSKFELPSVVGTAIGT